MRANKGFTLAELLIALAILGVIATFTIPKVLQSTTSGQNTAIAKEAASMISGAHAAHQMSNTFAATTTAGVLTQYMNYVSTSTANITVGGDTCGEADGMCLNLHNGAIMFLDTDAQFNHATTGSVSFIVDPDGTGAATGVQFILGTNGRLTTGANNSGFTAPADSTVAAITTDPTYLQNWN